MLRLLARVPLPGSRLDRRRASAILRRRSSRRASSSGIDIPSGTSTCPLPPPWPANRRPRPSVAPRACQRTHRKARCADSRWRGLVPSVRSCPSSERQSRAPTEEPRRTASRSPQEPPPKRGDRVVVGMIVRRDHRNATELRSPAPASGWRTPPSRNRKPTDPATSADDTKPNPSLGKPRSSGPGRDRRSLDDEPRQMLSEANRPPKVAEDN